MHKACVLWLSPFGRYSPWQVGITIWKKTWKAKGKRKGWHGKVKCPLQVIQEIGNCAKLLPAFSTPSCCLSTWISHLAFPLLVLCYASRAQLHHVRRAIFRGKLLQPCPAEQAGKGFPEASLLHDGIGMAELTLTRACSVCDLQPHQCLTCAVMGWKAVWYLMWKQTAIKSRKNGKKGQLLLCAFPEHSGEEATGQPLAAALSV